MNQFPSVHLIEIAYRDPLAAFQPFAADPICALLDSAAAGGARGRFSYIAAEPFQVIEASSEGVLVDGWMQPGDPFSVLERALAENALGGGEGTVPFRTGAVGFLGYELGRYLERLPFPHLGRPALPTMVMGLYDTIAAFDHQEKRAFILSSGRPEKSGESCKKRAVSRARAFAERLEDAPEKAPTADWSARSIFAPERSREEMERAIARVIAYIHAGDIFQANLTQQMRAPVPADLTDMGLYVRLRSLSPAPFGALLRCGQELSIFSASPERFLALSSDGRVETRPIKGTRPRGADDVQDALLAKELLASPKDRAENLMIVDLMRNDLGRVCRVGSVRVPTLFGLETFANVHHLVSGVEGRLRQGLGPVDLLRACFPGGSVTGAPKIRAMEIINDLECRPRGVYCGSIAWLGFDGAMDSSIVIRTIVRVGGLLLTQAGGGIVADSQPADEYQESLVKLTPMLRALSNENS